MPITEFQKAFLTSCRNKNLTKDDAFKEFRKPPDHEGYLAFADRINDEDGWECAGCGWKVGDEGTYILIPTQVVPASFGGTDDEDNLLPLCSRCNGRALAHNEVLKKQWVRDAEVRKQQGKSLPPFPPATLEVR